MYATYKIHLFFFAKLKIFFSSFSLDNNGFSVSTFSLATNEQWMDLENNKKEHTEWHNIVSWNKLADFTKEYIKKGQLVYIEGRIHTQSWVDKNNVRQKKYEIICDTITLLGPKK